MPVRELAYPILSPTRNCDGCQRSPHLPPARQLVRHLCTLAGTTK